MVLTSMMAPTRANSNDASFPVQRTRATPQSDRRVHPSTRLRPQSSHHRARAQQQQQQQQQQQERNEVVVVVVVINAVVGGEL